MTTGRDLVLYELYVRAFRDANGDGHSDLRGVVEKLDHVASLGVDVHLNENVTVFGTGRFDIINDSSDSLEAKVYLGLRFGF